MARPKKEVAEVIRFAQTRGFVMEGLTGSGHWRLRHKSGSIIILSATPHGGSRNRKNALALIQRIDSKDKP